MSKLKTFLLSFGIYLLISPAFIFADETLTITTYYPSPYGSYNQLSVASNTYLAYSSGSVGIGTSNPTAKLQIVDGNGTIYMSNYGCNGYGGMGFSSTITGCTNYSLLGEGANTFINRPSGGTMYFREGNGTQMVILPTSGYVGIGTPNPGNELAIVATVNDVIPALGSNGGRFGFFKYDSLSSGNYGFLAGLLGSGNVYMQVQRIDGTATAYHLLLQPNGGYVGIGTTTNPSQMLDVQGNIVIKRGSGAGNRYEVQVNRGRINFSNASNDNNHVIYNDYDNIDGEGSWDGMKMNVYNGLNIRVGNAGATSALYINSSGNVGIGTTTNLNSKLTVAGLPTGAPPGGTAAGAVWVDTNGSFYIPASSARFKDNIHNFNTDFSRILKAQAKAFNYKGSKNSDIGYIAEDFEALGLKDLLIYDAKGLPENIKYDRIPVYLLEIIKGQQSQIEELKSQLQAQESRTQKNEGDIAYLKQELVGSTAMLIESNKNLKANTKEIRDLKAEIISLKGKL